MFRLHRTLSRRIPDEYRDAEYLSELIFGDETIARLVADAKRLVIVPDGLMRNIPFAYLENEGRPLVHDVVIQLQPVLILPRVAKNNPQRKLSGAQLGSGGKGRVALHYVEQELEEIADIYRTESASSATRKQFLDALERHDVVHFAGHGVSPQVRGQFAALGLDDGDLSMGDLLTVGAESSADLVVLSSCELATSRALRGDARSVVDVLLAGGVGNVVGALWRVDDSEDLVRFFRYFHRRIRRGDAAAVALAKAQRWAIRKGMAPQLWAGFTVVSVRVADEGGAPSSRPRLRLAIVRLAVPLSLAPLVAAHALTDASSGVAGAPCAAVIFARHRTVERHSPPRSAARWLIRHRRAFGHKKGYHGVVGEPRSVRIIDCERGVAAQLAVRLVDKLKVNTGLKVARLSETASPGEQLAPRYRSELQRASLIVFIISDKWEEAALGSITEQLADAAEIPIFLVYVDQTIESQYQEYFNARWPLRRNNVHIFNYTEVVDESNLSRPARELALEVLARLEPLGQRKRRRFAVPALLVAAVLALASSFAWSRRPRVSTAITSPAELTVLCDADGSQLCDVLREELFYTVPIRCLHAPSAVIEMIRASASSTRRTLVLVRGREVELILEPQFWARLPADPQLSRRIGPLRAVDDHALVEFVDLVVGIGRGQAPALEPAELKLLKSDEEMLGLAVVLSFVAGAEPRGTALEVEARKQILERCEHSPHVPEHRRWLCPAIEDAKLVPKPDEKHKQPVGDQEFEFCRTEPWSARNFDEQLGRLLSDGIRIDPKTKEVRLDCERIPRWQLTIACLNAKVRLLNERSEDFDSMLRNIERSALRDQSCKWVPGLTSALSLELLRQLAAASEQQRDALLPEATNWACLAVQSWSSLNHGELNSGLVLNWVEQWVYSLESLESSRSASADGCDRDSLLLALDTLAPAPRDLEITNSTMLAAALFAWMIDPSRHRGRRLHAIYSRLSEGMALEYFDHSDHPWVTDKVEARCCAMTSQCICTLLQNGKTDELSERLNEILKSHDQAEHSSTSK